MNSLRFHRLPSVRCVHRCWALALVAVLGLGAAATGQVDTFEERTSVVEVQIPINVTTRNGEPIRGLTAEDFQIFDEGELQELVDFEVIDLATIEPEVGYTRRAREEIPSAARRNFLFLFDLTWSRPTTVVKARQAAQRFVLDSMHPTDLAAVATHTVESGMRLIVTFTPDRAQLARAIDTLGAPRLVAGQRNDPLRFVLGDLTDAGTATPDAGADQVELGTTFRSQAVNSYLSVVGNQMQRQEKSFARGKVSSWTRSLAEMARILGAIEGRKHVVYFSEGFDGRLLLGRNFDTEDPEQVQDTINIETGQFFFVDNDDRFGNTQLQNAVHLMQEEFKRTDTVLQVVDISGLSAEAAEQQRVRRVQRDALFAVADGTGGNLYQDANNFGYQLNKVLEQSAVTYLATIRPANLALDGAHHRLKVKAKLPRGSRVSHRSGYYAPRPFAGLHPLEKDLIASNQIASATPVNDLKMNVLTAPFRANAELAYVPVIVEIDGASLLVGHESNNLPVELYAYVSDDKGEMKAFFTQLVTLQLAAKHGAFADTGLKYYGHVELQPGSYLVRVLARNAVTGLTGVQTMPIEVPEYSEQELALLPPLFPEQPGSWFLVREQTATASGSTVYPFTLDGEPYIPAALPALSAEESSELFLVAYNLPAGEPRILGTVLAEDGSAVEGGTLNVERRTVTGIEGLDKLTATFEADGLAAGEYTLQVSITDSEGETIENSIRFRVL